MNYSSFSRFVLRTPLVSLEKLFEVLSKRKTADSIRALHLLFQTPLYKEALFLGSPSLHHRYQEYLEGKVKKEEDVESLFESLMKYFVRMSGRATPFGLFAGCNVGHTAEETSLRLGGEDELKRHTRLDMNFLCALAEYLGTQEGLREQLLYKPNNSLYSIGDEFRYIEYHYRNSRRHHQLTSVIRSEYLERIIQLAEKGALRADLAASLVEEDITLEEATSFINELINCQLLVSELEPAVSGSEFLEQIMEVLEGKDMNTLVNLAGQEQSVNLKEVLNLLQKYRGLLYDFDKNKTVDVQAYKDLASRLNAFGPKIDPKKLFQVDLVKAAPNCALGKKELESIKEALTFLNKITPRGNRSTLENFKNAFREKYEDKEVPLLEALDVESGVGYLQNNQAAADVSPLLEGLMVPGKGNSEQLMPWNHVQHVLLQKYMDYKSQNKAEISLTDEDFKGLEQSWDDQPDTLSTMVQLFREGDDITLSLAGAGGSSAANLLARFCYADEEMHTLVQNITRKEAQLADEEVVLAEIIHLPEARTGNVLLRPVIRQYEIPYLAKSAVSTDYQLPLEDLMVSVARNQIVLRSKKLNKVIIPRLTNAHNFSNNSLPVYHFLSDMQFQFNASGVRFSWGELFKSFKELPRVRYKQTIISKAEWTLSKDDIRELYQLPENQLVEGVGLWREKWKMPALVALADGDNELLIDMENELSIKVFLSSVKKRSAFRLIEFLNTKDNSPVRDLNGTHYVNQLVVSFYKNKAVDRRIYKPLLPSEKAPAQRTFITGDKWLYFKIYCGLKAADQLLSQTLLPLTERLLSEGKISKWFFIRYADPKPHVRIRFYSENLEAIPDILQLVRTELEAELETGKVWKIQTDSYRRELERYGTNTIDQAEKLFSLESRLILQVLQVIDDDSKEELRWIFAARYLDTLMTQFGFQDTDKYQFMEGQAEAYGREFHKNKMLSKQLNQKFRQIRNKLSLALSTEKELVKPFVFEAWLKSFVEHSKPFCNEILELDKENKLEVPIRNLLSSYTHMFMNRLFKSKQRMAEMVLYDLLRQYYRSEIARKKHEKTKISDMAPH